jgi:Tfp pilus assembly protein PilF
MLPRSADDRLAAAGILVATALLLLVSLIGHGTPLMGVETDLLGDSVPAARALREGAITPGTFLFRGPGYPLLLAGATCLTRGDAYLAARLVNIAAAAAALAAAYLMFRWFLGARAGLAVVAAMAGNSVFLQSAVEAGTDMPALAMGLWATWLVIRPGGWRAATAAGLVAGGAYLTRYNMVFLAPAGLLTLLVARRAARHVPAWAAGLALPVVGWTLAHLALTGELPRNQNYVNVAYEVYGGGMGYDAFSVRTGNQFASFADVALHDPIRFVLHVGGNLATRWIADAHRLVPVWIGALAAPGMAIAWWRRPGWRALAAHFLLAYLVLTLVFYTPRFFLYLLPFYLSGAFGLMLGSAPARPGWLGAAGRTVAIGAIVLSAAVAGRDTQRLLADPPDETRVAGEWLRGMAKPGQRIMARKPHVAYFAELEYLPIPYTERLSDFLAQARAARADYLFISGLETGLHPQLSVLADPDVSIPGLVPMAHRVLRPSHYYALYRFVLSGASPPAIEDSLVAAIRGFAARRPGQAWPQTYLGGHLLLVGRHREALGPLAEAERLAPGDALVARFQAMAHAELGEYDQAAAACERALRLVSEGAWERDFLGQIRLAQGRYAEARAELRRAMALEPANPTFPLHYLEACARGGFWSEAAAAADRILGATPDNATARLIGARAWLELGRRDRARALVVNAVVSGPDSAAFVAFSDSLRTAWGRQRR